MKGDMKRCGCPCHRVFGVFVILFGLSFLLERLDLISHSAASLAWPIFIVLAGFKMLIKNSCKCCSSGKDNEVECCDHEKGGCH